MNCEMNRQLCPNCKTGAESYRLDPKSAECPYLVYHTGRECKMYVPLDEDGGDGDEGV